MKNLLIAMCIGCIVLSGCGVETSTANNPETKTYTVHSSGQTYRNLQFVDYYMGHSSVRTFKTSSGKMVTFYQTCVVEEE